jgi:hypothetical protein
MKAVTGPRPINADRRTIETTQELIALYKREFGDSWQRVFSETVTITVTGPTFS